MFGSKCVQTDVLRSGFSLSGGMEYSTSVRCIGGLWSAMFVMLFPNFIGLSANVSIDQTNSKNRGKPQKIDSAKTL